MKLASLVEKGKTLGTSLPTTDEQTLYCLYLHALGKRCFIANGERLNEVMNIENAGWPG